MPISNPLEKLFETAVKHFPYKLERLESLPFKLHTDPAKRIYAQGYTFRAGIILDGPLVGRGCIDIERDSADTEPRIGCMFEIANESDYPMHSRLIKEHKGLVGVYDIKTQTWMLDY